MSSGLFKCGHEKTPENTNGEGRCRECRNAYYRERERRRYAEDRNGYLDRKRRRVRESGRRKRAAAGAKPRPGARKD